MKEVIRVHIAKVAYDIEVQAKQELEQYIKKLELYANDPDIMEDIELRITELLSERRVMAGGVIGAGDVEAVRTQLGEPEDFAGDDGVMDAAVEEPDEQLRRLYRDSEHAVLGGVLSGFSKYSKVNLVWVRLVFLAVLVGSFGTASVVYVVMWLIVPPAKTAAEKLELEGKPVTLESIRARGTEIEQQSVSQTPKKIRAILLGCLGLASALLAIGALVVTAVVVFGISIMADNPLAITSAENLEWVNVLALSLFVASGLLLSGLGVLVAYSALARRVSKKIGVAAAIIISLGLISFGGGMATVFAGVNYEEEYFQEAIERQQVDLDANFIDVKSLIASAHTAASSQGKYSEMMIEYVVDPGKPRYILEAMPGVRVGVNVQGAEARIALKSSSEYNRVSDRAPRPRLIIYGPMLEQVSVHQGYFQYTGPHQDQQDIHIETLGVTVATLYGTYGELRTTGAGRVETENATVYSLKSELAGEGAVRAGVVRELSISQSDVCPAMDGRRENQAIIAGVSSGKMIYNDVERSAQTIVGDCGTVVIGSENNREMWDN